MRAANRVPARLELEPASSSRSVRYDRKTTTPSIVARSKPAVNDGSTRARSNSSVTVIGRLLKNAAAGDTVLVGDRDLADLAQLVAEQVVVGPASASVVRSSDRCEIAADDGLRIALGASLPFSSRMPVRQRRRMACMLWLTKSTVRPLGRNLRHAAEALLLELGIADGEHLVDDQDLRLQVRRHGERESHVHPARVPLDRRVDVLLDSGERRRSRRTCVAPRPCFMPRIAPFK